MAEKKTILIIEDENSLRKILEKAISNEGLNVDGANNGEEGLAMALKNHPDLILLDLLMPKMLGLKVLEKLRKDEWGKDVPVIILTNLDFEDKKEELENDHNCEYMVKASWRLEDVVKKVKEKLEK
jgi:DNA-binding response OmpR family regulator